MEQSAWNMSIEGQQACFVSHLGLSLDGGRFVPREMNILSKFGNLYIICD